ncbi:amidohydrolase family protein [Saccharopolyspora sp. MS10]|uniref:amidohydrolase family protein n=1 Tax=Saccharopolyspora sp. MS10 TaxID=3385973 RepID=UPI0039A23C83
MTVDAHHHLWDIDVRERPWIAGPEMEPLRRDFRPTDLAQALRGTQVDTTVLVQSATDPEEAPEMLVLADSASCIGGVVGWVDLSARAVRGQLADLLSHPAGRWLKGVRHPVAHEPDAEWLTRPEVSRGLAAVEDAGLLFELAVGPEQLPSAIKVVGDFPQLTFVLDHCGRPPIGGDLAGWESSVRRLAGHPNSVCKLAGLATAAGWGGKPEPAELLPCVEVLLDAFGPGRMMFGSDWPVCLLSASYREVLELTSELLGGLPQQDRMSIFDGTARQVYGL